MKENVKTYILSKLSNIVEDCPELKIEYKYESLNKEHLIKVLPLDEYKNNINYQNLEETIIFEFINKFPHDSLVFFSEDEWIDIDIPDKIFEGSIYREMHYTGINERFYTNILNQDLFIIKNIEEDILNLSPIIEDYSQFYFTDIKSNNDILSLNLISNDYYGIHFGKCYCKKSFGNFDKDNLEPMFDECINYSLAA